MSEMEYIEKRKKLLELDRQIKTLEKSEGAKYKIDIINKIAKLKLERECLLNSRE